MLTALIMAGGKGTRFWPMSTEEKPKQFLSLIENRTMLQITVDRLLNRMNIENIFICTGSKYVSLVSEQLPDLPKQNIIVEPIGRNTAPCILLSTLYIKQIYQDANIVVLPSDHMINDVEEFLNVLYDGNEFINQNNESIITIGITPDRPETGYGYIKYHNQIESQTNHSIYKVDKFVEKPNIDKANEYLQSGDYLWNAGMFMFNSNFMLKEMNTYFKKSFDILSGLPTTNDANYMSELENKYKECEAISIDYAIMEKSEYIYVIPSDFGWDDIGSWKALERYIDSDSNGNILKGNMKLFNSNTNTVYSTEKEIVLLDIDNIFCIETDERIVIGKKDSLSKVHELREKV
ncbi:MAG: mannose-1-phosphate guanylyltransferase [Erysipelotrichaceae bacterium]|nr:mannose-1-phosphate guanylyltransferase [Erysipelotrichaceae bacterium]